MVRLELVQLNHRLGLAGVHVAGPCGAIEQKQDADNILYTMCMSFFTGINSLF